MNSAIFQSAVRPNLPLRRPATSLGTAPRIITPPFGEKKSCLSPGGLAVSPGVGDAAKMDSGRKDNGSLPAEDSPSKLFPGSPAVVKLCNYCSQQGNLRCTRCKKTCYCSVACQTEDWKAHRHVCKPSTPDSPVSNKIQEAVASPASSVLKSPEAMMKTPTMGQVKRMYLHELPKNKIIKGAQLQACVLELRNPGKFFIQVQTTEMLASLHSITVALQKTYAGSLGTEYLPDYGELCAVKYSQDQNWYRGAVQSADASSKNANILYVDFGNQEVVTLDRIKPLSLCVDPAPVCAVECRVAGVVALTGSWTEECCIGSRQLLAGKSLPMTVIDVPDNSDVWAVDLMPPAVGKKFSTFLVEQGYAVEESGRPSDQDIDSILSAALENFRRSAGGRQDNVGILLPEPLTQGLGDSFSAMVTHVQSPSELICQKVENASVIQEMQLKLREHCTQTAAGEDFSPAPGSVCCSQFTEDHQWYRATVLGYSSESRVCVGYIDFGNSEEVDLSRLRPITAELAALPMQAIPCVLAEVKPFSDKWSDEAISLLKKSVCNKFVRVEIVGERQSAALVVLTDEYSDPQTSVNELLLASGHALLDDTMASPDVGQAPGNPPAPLPAPGNSPTGDSTPMPVEKPHKMEEPSAAGPPTCPLQWSCAELPCDGQTVELVISVIENPGEFYCHHYNSKDIRALKELSSQVLEHCRSQSAPFTPVVGEPCCAVFPGDGSWYRAMVLGLTPDKKATVYFVDYGNTSTVEQAHTRAIPPQFLKLPFQAIRCWLAEDCVPLPCEHSIRNKAETGPPLSVPPGAEPPQGGWGADAVRQFQVLSLGRQLQAQVCSITERGFGVRLRSDGRSIAAQLGTQGLAKASGHQEPAAVPQGLPGGTFPVDWKTVELPRNKPFQPRVAAIISPSLFYIMREDNKDTEKVPALMKDLAAHCCLLTKASPRDPQPGAACCAQLPGDKSWYRAVVLRTAGCEVEIVCADYGNVEKVPLSNIVPIAEQHLSLPFQIARCALSGKELFPAEWTESVLEMFSSQLRAAAQAAIDRFDGTFNLTVLMLTEAATPQAGTARQSSPEEPRTSATAAVKPRDMSKHPAPEAAKTKTVLKEAKAGPPTPEAKSKERPQQDSKRCAKDASVSNADGECCCSHLIQKINRLEELIMLLMKQLGTSLPKN
ncbi:tudor domain-containing protein 1 isoform X3 [Conger conger]|uniref:tudor domain-containing protein 1 isoform X3 n=1 Tax=Conger conger TaxID=82655 RepID=UPI002A5ACC7D|nr:tudor domain-containing protein 1 isoform X3 [Conger conger]